MENGHLNESFDKAKNTKFELFTPMHKQINQNFETPGISKKLNFDYNLIEYINEIVVSK